MHYLPLAPGFFAILVGFFIVVLILRSLSYAYESLGVSSNAAILLMFASLVGSIFNIPVAELPPERILSNEVIHFFGMRYKVPVVAHWSRTVIAINIGGAVIPTLMSLYLLIKRELWLNGLIATRTGDSLDGLPRSGARDRGAGAHASLGHCRCGATSVAQGCAATGLYCRRPRHADWR